jgi:uncharacterized protein (TIGR02594 family)
MPIAKGFDGLRERTPEGLLNEVVRDFFRSTRFPLQLVTLHTAWCGAFACAVLEMARRPSPRSARARDFLRYGVELRYPVFGSILVFERGSGRADDERGHVGFCDRTPALAASDVSCFAGNQSNAACTRLQPMRLLLGVRWPPGCALSPDAEVVH